MKMLVLGTTTPSHLLTLQRTSDSGYDGINFKKSTGESRAVIMTNPSDNGYMQLHDSSNTYNEVLIHSSGDSYFNGGNVGIGTTSPVSALHVKTTTQFQGIFLDDESGLIAKIARGDATGDPYFKLYSSISSNGVDIQSNGSSYFNGGNVGIGTTSPTKKLHITGDGGNDAAIKIQSTNSSGAGFMYMQRNTDGKSYVLNGSNQALILGANNNTSQLYLKENGNVGIGTTAPATKLQVGNQPIHSNARVWDANTPLALFHPTVTSNTVLNDPKPVLILGRDGTSSEAYGALATFNLSRYENNSTNSRTRLDLALTKNNFVDVNVMTLLSSGNVGIGTTAPATKLQVGNGTEQHVWIKTASLAGHYSGIKLTRGNGTWSNNSNNNFGLAVTDNGFSIGKYTDPGSNSTGRSDYLTINAGGNVGIGTASPTIDLHVVGNIMAEGAWLRTTGSRGWYNQTYGSGWYMTDNNWIRTIGSNKGLYVGGYVGNNFNGKYFSETTNGTVYYNGGSNLGILASYGIVGDWIGAFSDERIKDVIGRSNSKDDLSDLLAVEVTDYKMKDKVQYGEKVTKKVIAQQLKTVFPQAVSLQTKVIPDIYEVSEINEGYIALDTDLKKGDRVKLIFEDDEQTNEELVEVLSTDKNGFTVDNKKEGKVFVYGKEVDDFHVVDYDAVSMLNISATQELYKLILKQQKTIDEQKAQVDVQKAQISAQIDESKKVQSNFDERIKYLENLFNISKIND